MEQRRGSVAQANRGVFVWLHVIAVVTPFVLAASATVTHEARAGHCSARPGHCCTGGDRKSGISLRCGFNGTYGNVLHYYCCDSLPAPIALGGRHGAVEPEKKEERAKEGTSQFGPWLRQVSGFE